MAEHTEFVHPHDTPASSGFRFLTEIIAWVSGPWAASLVHPLLAVVVLAVLIGLPTVFTTKGDKRHMVVDTPGWGRVLAELVQYIVAAAAPWVVWPSWLAAICTLVVILSLVLGWSRTRWLLDGAPAVD